MVRARPLENTARDCRWYQGNVLRPQHKTNIMMMIVKFMACASAGGCYDADAIGESFRTLNVVFDLSHRYISSSFRPRKMISS